MAGIDQKEVKSFIHGNLKGTLGLQEVSAAFDMHPTNLDRTFRTFEGITVKRYIDGRLMEKAEFLIRRNGMKGYSIGRDLGFWSDQSFYRWVKRVFGVGYSTLEKHLRHTHKTGEPT